MNEDGKLTPEEITDLLNSAHEAEVAAVTAAAAVLAADNSTEEQKSEASDILNDRKRDLED